MKRRPIISRPTRHCMSLMGAFIIWVVYSAAVLAGPELRGYGAHMPFDVQESAVNWGDAVTIRLDVGNYGANDAGAFYVGLYLSADTTMGDAEDYLFQTVNFSGGLQSGRVGYLDYTSIPLPAVNPLAGEPTTVYIGMVVDVYNDVAEDNEGNNKNLGHTIDRDDTPVTITPGMPDIFVTDSADPGDDHIVAFADVADDGVGNARGVQTLTVMNKGKVALTVNDLSLSGSADFSIVEIASSVQNFISLSSLPRVIAANGGESWVITLQFDPTVAGAATGAFTIESDDPDSASIAVGLTGTGIAVPDIALTTPQAAQTDFADVVQDGSGGFQSTRTITVKNAGTGPLTVSPHGISLLTGTHYSLVSVTSSTQGGIDLASGSATLAAGGVELWDIVVRFDPLVLGQCSDGIQVLSDDPDEPTFTVSLTGCGVRPMALQVADSVGTPDDRMISFPDTHADGLVLEQSVESITLCNTGDADLTVVQNGLTMAGGVHFHLDGITSDVAGDIDLAAGPASLAGGTGETWTVMVVFDPAASGVLNDTLSINSDDPASPVVEVALTGQGLDVPALAVRDSVLPADDRAVDFGAVLNDGASGREGVETVILKNMGTQPVVIAQHGLVLSGSSRFRVDSVVSSIRGAVDPAAAADAERTIASAQAETWVITLVYDPQASSPATGVLQMVSNDPLQPVVEMDLRGVGEVPDILPGAPDTLLNVSAGTVFTFTWQDTYTAGDGAIALFLDTDMNPASGLIEIARDISEDDPADAYGWRVDSAWVGNAYYVYATISDGLVTNGNYAVGQLHIDPSGSFILRSPTEVTSPDYAYEYEYDGQVYQGISHLHAGYNTLTVSNAVAGGGTAAFQFGVTLVPSLIHTEQTCHDELNRVVETKNGNGITTVYTYDHMGRIISRESDNGMAVQYTYDVLSRRTSMTDYTGTTFYEMDDLDRITAIIRSENALKGDSDDLAMRYEYDTAGCRTAVIYPDGERTQYTYDEAGRMVSVTNVTRGLGFQYAYNLANGLLTTLTRPNGIETHTSYDGMGRLTNICHQRVGGERIINFGYVYDAAGKVTDVYTTGSNGAERLEHYTYDRFDRLSEVVYSDDSVVDLNDKTVSYTYDGNGNRLSMTTRVDDAVSAVRLLVYGNENRLLRVTDGAGTTLAGYAYDAAGNLIQETTLERTRFFSYDERNQLISVSDGSNHVMYAYNGDGVRVSKTVNGAVTYFINDENRTLWETVQERDANGILTASFTMGGHRLARYEPPAVVFDLQDRIGSVRRVTDPAGGLAASCDVEVFGKTVAMQGSPGCFGFTGERLDEETGFIFLRARYYDPTLGRFISKDPLGIDAGLNSYVYVGNNPVNLVDPSGLIAVVDDKIVAVAGAAGGLVSQIFSDVITGNLSDFSDYAGAAAGGAVSAELIWNGTIMSGGAGIYPIAVASKTVGGAVDSTVSQGVEMLWQAAKNKITGASTDISFSLAKVKDDALWSGASTAILGPLAKIIKAPGQTFTKAFSSSVDPYARGLGTKLLKGSISKLYEAGTKRVSDAAFGMIVSQDVTKNVVKSVFMTQSLGDPPMDVGGVLLDKAAQLVGSNLSDLRGAVYDPISGQFVFLGTDGAAAVKDIDLDYLYTALQAVYGSAVPPFVTLDPPASAYTQWSDFGDGDEIFEPGEKAGFLLRYNPIWSEEDTTLDVTIEAEWSGTYYTWTARFDCLPENIYAGGRRMMKVVFDEWIEAPPSGVTLDTTPWQWHVFTQSAYHLNADGQDSFTRFTLHNGTAGNFLITDLRVIPARQHRKFGGRVEDTRLGWVMLEADRVMKCLSVGKDNLSDAVYNSGTIAVAGYSNMTERGGSGGNIRMWFTPNEMTLKRHIDADTGRASIVFDQASVALNTESFMMGLPQPPEARAFADHFTANYDAFAALDFPCVDPDDPSGTAIIQVKIFDMLRDAMQAVSLARFFRDNDVPVDMWWLNSWQPELAYSPRSTATAYNEENGMIIYGGVGVNKPNAYVPSTTAGSVADMVQAARPDVPADPSADIQEQVWSASTVEGDIRAVAAQTQAEPQDGNVNLAETDLSFASPGALPLQFARFYQSSWLGRYQMGPGWRYAPYALEFERPSWFDEQGLMKDEAGEVLWHDSNKDTRLRSGMVRVVDLQSGEALDFVSSLVLGYTVDNIGNARITVSGLDSNNLPVFAEGTRKSGATLKQIEDERKYEFRTPDGASLIFDYEGRLLETEDRHANQQVYTWDNDKHILLSIADGIGQTLTLAYNAESNRVMSVTGPGSEQVTYTYTAAGCLERATHVRSGGYVQYAYNDDHQLIGKQLYNGLEVLQATPDLRGRANEMVDLRSNILETAYSLSEDGAVRTTEIEDPRVSNPAFQPRQCRFDRSGRLLASRDATGAETLLGYDAGSLAPTSIDLPIAGRPVIGIERNERGQPVRLSDPGNTGALDVIAAYDSESKQLCEMTDQAGRHTALTYDTHHNLMRVGRQLNGQDIGVAYGYTDSGALHVMTNALGVAVSTMYRDGLDRVTNVVDATGVAIGYEYDALGRLWKVYDPRLSVPIEYVYNDFDQVIEIRYPVGSVFFTYDAAMGWLTGKTDILGRVTRYVRDPNTGDILQIIEEEAGEADRVIELAYNRFGQLTNMVSPDAQMITFRYDDLGRSLGRAEKDDVPPGAPKALDSDRADYGVATFSSNHVFTWGAPDTDSGIAGYSVGLGVAADETVDTVAATSAWLGVESGTHTVTVRAVANSGLWGPSASFVLVVRSMSEYDHWRVQHFPAAQADDDLVSGPDVDFDEDGMINEREFIADTDPTEASSALKILGVTEEIGGLRVDWKGGRQAIQILESRERLTQGSWEPTFTNHPPTAIETNILDAVDVEKTRFYRIKATR